MSEDAAEMCGRPQFVGRAGIVAEPPPGVKLDLSSLGTERGGQEKKQPEEPHLSPQPQRRGFPPVRAEPCDVRGDEGGAA